LLVIFVVGPHFIWCLKSRWSLPFGAFVALKINKNKLKAKKLQPLEIGGLEKILNQTAHNLFSNPSKISLNITWLPLELQDDL